MLQRAGVRIVEMRLNELNYAPEIAGMMLKKQQAGALLEARQIIVDGAVSIAEDAIRKLDANGTVKSQQKISDTQGGFTGDLDNDDYFGNSVAALGDLDGDGGPPDLAVGAWQDDDGGSDRGAVWVLTMQPVACT